MIVGTVTETKTEEYRVRADAAGRGRHRERGAYGARGGGGGGGIELLGRGVRRRRRAAGAERRGGLRVRRAALRGEGAAAVRVRAAAPRPDAVHLPAPGGGGSGHRRPAGVRLPRRSATRRWSATTASCRCWRRCRRWRGGWPSRWPPSSLKKPGPGSGQLLGGLPGVPPAHVVVEGSGTVGKNACRAAVGAGARVTVLSIQRGPAAQPGGVVRGPDRNGAGQRAERGPGGVRGRRRDRRGAGAGAPRPGRGDAGDVCAPCTTGAVIVDVAVDQGGCVETTRPTDHRNPIYVEEGVVHYAVPNMPGSVPRTSFGGR